MTHASVLAANPGFQPPSTWDFVFQPHSVLLWKSSFLLVLGAVIVFVFYFSTSRKGSIVPSKLQFAGESAYSFVRDDISRDLIGEKDFIKFTPLLVTTFSFVLVNNLFGIIPFLQFPTFSRVGFAYGLAAMVWIIYNGVGIRKHGFLHYLKLQTVPSGVRGPLLVLVVPLEFLSNILVRPMTLSLRLFANMFAGHLLLGLFALGADYLFLHATGNIVVKPAGVVSFGMGIAVGFLELIVEVLQAYVFVLLTATYISGAIADEH